MAGKPTYNELERKNKQLEKEVLEYIRKAKELNKKRKVTERSHIKRTISLMHLIEGKTERLRNSNNLIQKNWRWLLINLKSESKS
jgi:RNase P subunit RPR2